MERNLLNAAGTPMIKPLPEDSSFARLTLVPGVVSMRSTEGIASPVLTILAAVVVNVRGIKRDRYEVTLLFRQTRNRSMKVQGSRNGEGSVYMLYGLRIGKQHRGSLAGGYGFPADDFHPAAASSDR